MDLENQENQDCENSGSNKKSSGKPETIVLNKHYSKAASSLVKR